jgi:hypothetical protein
VKFFGRIRKSLLAAGNTGKYFRYAVGEILLVVLGILIALQINNWNEGLKSQRLAKEVYTNLLTSLRQDSVEVKRTIDLLTISLEVQRKLILEETSQYQREINQEELDNTVGAISASVMSFFPKTGVYNLITSNNSMDLLQSAQIKSLLINLYDFQYKRYENVDAIIDHKYHYQLGSLIRKEIGFIGSYNSDSEFTMISPTDPVKYKSHFYELISECRDIYGILSTGNNYLIQIQQSIHELILLIRKELAE